MEGDSLPDAIAFLALAGLFLVTSRERTSKPAEVALSLLFMAAMGLPLLGYRPTISWSFLVEGSIAACAAAFVFALVRYGRSELAGGEYDQRVDGPG
jgi:hypothetical protein